jgi:hypothetical protein
VLYTTKYHPFNTNDDEIALSVETKG